MQKVWLCLLVLSFVYILGTSCAFAAPHSKGSPPGRAILLVAFGTSVPDAQKAFDNIDDQARKAFPGVEIRWAFTSSTIRAKLAKEGKHLDSPEVALARLMEAGYTHVAVSSLHVIPGEEFHDLNRNVQLFSRMAGGLERALVASPLLSSHDDMVRVAKALLKHAPRQRNADEAVLFMGHGSRKHPSDAIYSAMNYLIQDLSPNVFIATVEGHPNLDEILPKLSRKGIKKARLAPLMVVAGVHARDDMMGDDPESWKSVLSRNGIACEATLAGIAEYPEIVEVWLDHLRETFAQL